MDAIIMLRLLYLSLSDDIVIWTVSFRRTVSFRNEHCVEYFYSLFQNSPWKSIRKRLANGTIIMNILLNSMSMVFLLVR